jgi:hypothetical protein
MTCPECGHENYHAAESCVKCGARFDTGLSTDPAAGNAGILDGLLHPFGRRRREDPASGTRSAHR